MNRNEDALRRLKNAIGYSAVLRSINWILNCAFWVHIREDHYDPIPYTSEIPSLRSVFGRVDIHTLAAFWVKETKIVGPYLEFGVANARSTIAALRANRRYNPTTVTRFLLFDSFEGLPPLEGKDTGSAQFQAGQYAYTQEYVRNVLQLYGVWHDGIVMTPGYYEHSLPAFDVSQFQGQKAAIVHVDVDLYSSAKEALDFVAPHVQDGTFMLFDDWSAFNARNDKGERAAAKEWLERNPSFHLEPYAQYSWPGQAFILNIG